MMKLSQSDCKRFKRLNNKISLLLVYYFNAENTHIVTNTEGLGFKFKNSPYLKKVAMQFLTFMVLANPTFLIYLVSTLDKHLSNPVFHYSDFLG